MRERENSDLWACSRRDEIHDRFNRCMKKKSNRKK